VSATQPNGMVLLYDLRHSGNSKPALSLQYSKKGLTSHVYVDANTLALGYSDGAIEIVDDRFVTSEPPKQSKYVIAYVLNVFFYQHDFVT
jgi:hypothetical protein